MVALLHDEPAAARVEEAVERGATISWINLGEVYYLEARRFGDVAAAHAVEAIRRDVEAELPDEEMVLAAARLKAGHRLSYADAFAVATAERHGTQLLTGDPEILALDHAVQRVDLRGGG